MEAADVLHLEPHGADTFVGAGPQYPWGGLYGGQIVAQALIAASHTVDDGLQPHSLRAYFIRSGDHLEPVRYEVDRLRNGRSFTTRRVVARQERAILNLEVSFTRGEPSKHRQRLAAPAMPAPDQLDGDQWIEYFERRFEPYVLESGEASMWLRWTAPIGDDPVTHAAAFAYLSDDVPADAIKALLFHTEREREHFDEEWFAVSLDHTIWFHAPCRADQWQLHAFHCDRFVGGRGLSIGEVFSEDGVHLATVAQEMLFRRRR